MLTWAEALKLLPADEADHPKVYCRGCAGLGFGGDEVTPRIAQMLHTAHGMGAWKFSKGRGVRFVRITPHRYRARGVIHAPFVIACAVIQGLQSDPEWESDPSNAPIDRAWKCPWCHGTGRPNLTVHQMETITKP